MTTRTLLGRQPYFRAALGTVVVGLIACGIGPGLASAARDSNELAAPEKLSIERLPNAYRMNDKVISGGLPEGVEGFQALQKLGVKTIISVDGTKPELKLARKLGMRYVHMPHGYGGIPEARGKELAKAVRDLPGPVYIHCHHGKHRSPVAAVVACVTLGWLPHERAEQTLNTIGTGTNYKGLYRSADEARPLDSRQLDALDVSYPETVRIPPLAEGMVAIERTFDHLKQLSQSKWKPPAEHPDLDAAHEALLLREHYTELLRTDEVRREPQAFQQHLKDSEAIAVRLETVLSATPLDAPEAMKSFARVTQDCNHCHARFRDIPKEKREPKP